MSDGFSWWLVILGIAIGMAVVWLVVARLPRGEDDIGDDELVGEAAWISRTINAYGGVAPQPLVEEVLELHRQYLTGAVQEPPLDLLPAEEGTAGLTALVERNGDQRRPERLAGPDERLSPDHAPDVGGPEAAVTVTGSNSGDGTHGGGGPSMVASGEALEATSKTTASTDPVAPDWEKVRPAAGRSDPRGGTHAVDEDQGADQG